MKISVRHRLESIIYWFWFSLLILIYSSSWNLSKSITKSLFLVFPGLIHILEPHQTFSPYLILILEPHEIIIPQLILILEPHSMLFV